MLNEVLKNRDRGPNKCSTGRPCQSSKKRIVARIGSAGSSSGDGSCTSAYSSTNPGVLGLIRQSAHLSDFCARNGESRGTKGPRQMNFAHQTVLISTLNDTKIFLLRFNDDVRAGPQILYNPPVIQLFSCART